MESSTGTHIWETDQHCIQYTAHVPIPMYKATTDQQYGSLEDVTVTDGHMAGEFVAQLVKIIRS